MKAVERKEKMIAAGAVVLLIASFILSVIFFSSNKSLEKALNETKLKAETMLSEKLSLEKQMAKIKMEFDGLMKKNGESNKLLAVANTKILQQETKMQTIVSENSQQKKSLENRLAEIQKSKSQLEKQMSDLTLYYNNLKSENSDLSEAMAVLEKENKDLRNNLMIMAALDADNFRIEGLKRKNDRLTVNSRNVKKLKVSFDVPLLSTANLNFKINTPDGKSYTSQDGSISYIIVDEEKDWLASTSSTRNEIEVAKRIEMIYHPTQKLKSGVYTIDLLSNDMKVKSVQIRLK